MRVEADILVEREGHKRMVIGRDGETLKRAATAARKEMEMMTGGKVHLVRKGEGERMAGKREPLEGDGDLICARPCVGL